MDEPSEEFLREIFNTFMGYNSRKEPPPSYFDEMMKRTEDLIQEGRLRTALDQIFPLLERNPNDEWAFELAAYVFYAHQNYDNDYYAPERLTDEYIYDCRLDKIFCECNRCSSFWVPNPLLRSRASVFDLNPIGGQCPQCNRVFCLECSTLDGQCPDCRTRLEVVSEPNGRTQSQARRRKEKIELVLIFREGPIPPDTEYIVKLLQRYSPDVLKEKPQIAAIPEFPWPDKHDLAHKIKIISSQIRGRLLNSNLIEGFSASDEERNKFLLIKFYEEPQG